MLGFVPQPNLHDYEGVLKMASGRNIQLTKQIGEYLVACELARSSVGWVEEQNPTCMTLFF